MLFRLSGILSLTTVSNMYAQVGLFHYLIIWIPPLSAGQKVSVLILNYIGMAFFFFLTSAPLPNISPLYVVLLSTCGSVQDAQEEEEWILPHLTWSNPEDPGRTVFAKYYH